MYRFFYFLASISLPAIFGWWLFVPLALLSVYLVKLPYEIVLAAGLLDMNYYFGDSFLEAHQLTLFAAAILLIAIFLNDRVYWERRI